MKIYNFKRLTAISLLGFVCGASAQTIDSETLLNVFRESTREAQKRNPRESSLVFERETTARRRTRNRISFSHHRFKNSNARDERPQNQDIIIIIATHARSKQRERKKEHVYNRIPGDGVKFHKLLASPTFGPCSAIMLCNEFFL